MKWLTIGVSMSLTIGMALAGSGAILTPKIAEKRKIIRVDQFYGFDRTVFDFDGYEAWVVEPKAGTERKGHPWTWTMQWATAFVLRTGVPKLLADGYHHATIITYKDKMDETGLKVSARFQKYLVDELGFAPKADLIGMSWGGFFSVRYAATYPQNVDKVYLDAPLLCFRDFDPKGQGPNANHGPWAQCPPADGMWTKDSRMPVNMAGRLAATGIPIFLVYGGQDKSCPAESNALPFIERFKAAGGDKNLKVLYREYFGHHPHGMEESDNSIIEFFESERDELARSANLSALERLRATVHGGEITEVRWHNQEDTEPSWLKGAPACAIVHFTLRPTSESEIHCRLLLPSLEKWNGRFWGIGNTALGDSLDPLHVSAYHLPRLAEGAATCEADMGTANGRFGREVVRDFGWRSHHLMCIEAKKLIEAFYGRKAKRNYFYGVSSGGGQGLHEAQRFPEDYDGIVSYVPAHYRTRLVTEGRNAYRTGVRKKKNFMNRVLAGPMAINEYDMDDATFGAFIEMIRDDVDAASTDLDAFMKRGGKLIVVSGLSDRIVPSVTARDYCKELIKHYGTAEKIETFFRAYFLPGRGHTQAETPDGVEDIPSTAALVDWVERGIAPGPLLGKRKNGGECLITPWKGAD